jgi:DNA mismatch repair protein MutL
MPRIQILPEIISNKIAAGEVVERPASVAKELLENALDAGAKRIIIDIAKGGRQLIRVSDDGCGMGRDDALLCLERYATSKIRDDSDLFAISTLGFRGEAIPSIAAVSRFTLVTREESSASGVDIRVNGGTISQVNEIGAPHGTMISVEQLFFNTPARRKFLKTISTEMGHVADTVASLALAWPAVHFHLRHNDKTVKRWPAVTDPFDRIVDVLGKDLRTDLHRIDLSSPAMNLQGWLASPLAARSTSRGIFVFVNGRRIRDRVVQHALLAGYTGRLMKGQFPVAVLFLDVPFDQVDVNVHPTKHEVRFANQKAIHSTVSQAVASALRSHERVRRQEIHSEPIEKGGVAESFFRYPSLPSEPTPVGSEKVTSPTRISFEEKIQTAADPIATETSHPLGVASEPAQQADLWARKPFGDLKIIGQLHYTYILCESEDGLVLIDQHAAHERVLYEQLQARQLQKDRPPVQKLLLPETIELSFEEAALLEKMLSELNALGIEIEPFGGSTFAIKAVPTLLADREAAPLIHEIVEKMATLDVKAGVSGFLDPCLKLMACHGSIRAHQQLSVTEMQKLLDQMDACENPSNCPHGRPTWVKWGQRTLEKAFNRIV